MRGLLVASPMSGSGKTTFTLGLLRALRKRGVGIAPGKAGPDYIDPAFHLAASGEPCLNYDPWAMRSGLLLANAVRAAGAGDRLLVIEAMMGLFDAAADGTGSAADLAALLRLPVVFVVNSAKMSHSVAALVRGFNDFDPNVMIAGVVLNNVGSDRHERLLRDSLATTGIDVLGVLRRDQALRLPERHLGLVQAGEHVDLERFVERASERVDAACDLEALTALAGSLGAPPAETGVESLPPPGQRLAVARDLAFAFSYEHVLQGWRSAGAELRFFSPLANEMPAPDSDAVYLPGGYPELHAARLAGNATFKRGIAAAARSGVPVYGECGGYTVLGDALIDADGGSHAMLGLLPLTTSFSTRRLHLGYRRLSPAREFFWHMPVTAHEFHYASIVNEGEADRLFGVEDARGETMPGVGLRRGSVAGSFMHVIDRAASV